MHFELSITDTRFMNMKPEERNAAMEIKRKKDLEEPYDGQGEQNPFPAWVKELIKCSVEADGGKATYDIDNSCYCFDLDKDFDESETFIKAVQQIYAEEAAGDPVKAEFQASHPLHFSCTDVDQDVAMQDLVDSHTPAGGKSGAGRGDK